MLGGRGDIAIRYVITALDKGTKSVVSAQASVTKSVREANEALREQTAQQAKAAASSARVAASADKAAGSQQRLSSSSKQAGSSMGGSAAGADKASAANKRLTDTSNAAAAAARRNADAQKGFAASMVGAGGAVSAAGHKMSGLTVPIAAIALASGASAAKFQKDMLMIETEAGGPRGEVKKLTDQVLALAKTTQVGPDELAKGLYHLESIGLRGAKAMDALKLSAQGASISGADLEETTSALGSAWLVNIKGAGSLTHSMALMNAAAGAGNMRLGDLVHALGTGLLPASKEAGLGIKDALAALAVFTDEGYQASSAAAQMSTALHFLYNPTNKASDAMGDMGLKSDQLAKDMHKPNGLLVALRDLKKHLEEGGAAGAKFKEIKLPDGSTKLVAQNRAAIDQEQMLGRILPGGRGRIMLTLLNQLDRYQMKIDQIGHTTGHFSEAVAKTQETASFRVQSAWSQIQVAGIELGDKLLPATVPIMEKVADAVDAVSKAFGNLSPHMQTTVVALTIGLGLLGPVLKITGSLTSSLGTLGGAFSKLGKWIAGTTDLNLALADSEMAVAAGMDAEVASSAVASRTAVAGAVTSPGGVILPAGGTAAREAEAAARIAPIAEEAVVGASAAGGLRGLLGRAGRGARGMLGRGVARAPMAGGMFLAGSLATNLIPDSAGGGHAKGVASMAMTGASLGMLAGPWGALAGGVIGAGAGVLMDKNLRESVGKSMKSAGKWVGKEMEPVLDATADAWKDSTGWVTTATKNIGDAMSDAWGATVHVVKTALSPVVAVVKTVFGTILSVIKIALIPVAVYFKVQFAIWKAIFTVGWAVVRTVFLVAFAAIYESIKIAWNVVSAYFKLSFTVWSAVFKAGWAVIKAVFTAGLDVITTTVKIYLAILKAEWSVIAAIFGPPVRAAWAVVKAIFSAGKAAVIATVRTLVSGIRTVFGGIKSVVTGPLHDAWDAVSGVVGDWGGRLFNLGKRAVGRLADGFSGVGKAIIGALGDAVGAAGGVGNAIKNWLNDHTILGDKVKIGPISARIPALAGGGYIDDAITAAVSPGERVLMPGGGEWTVPGRPTAADSVITQLPAGSAVLTWSGQDLFDSGASLGYALAAQTPHFQNGGVVRRFQDGGNVFDTGLGNPASSLTAPVKPKPKPKAKKKSSSGVPDGYHEVDPNDVTSERGKGEKGGKKPSTPAAWAGRYVATAYGPPWEGIQGTGTTATGINLKSAPHRYLVAVDPKVIPLHSKLRINPNPFGVDNLVFSAEDTGGAIKGKRIDFYDWRGRATQNRFGRKNVMVHSASGGSSNSRELKTVAGPRIADIGPLTAAQAKANLHDLLKPAGDNPFRAGYDMGATGLGGRVGGSDSQILADTIKASRVAFKSTTRTVSVSSGSSGNDASVAAGQDTPSGKWNPNKKPIAGWIIPYLRWAAKNGWSGIVNSGVRTYAEQKRIWDSGVRPAARPGTSNHEQTKFPGGAVDVSGAAQLSAILQKRPGAHNLVWAGAKDPVHFSHPHNGSYRRGGMVGRFGRATPRFATGGVVRQRASAAAPLQSFIQESTTQITAIGSKDHNGLKVALTRLADELDVTVGAMVARAERQIAAMRKNGLTKTERVDVSKLQASIRRLSKLPDDANAITYKGLEQTAAAIKANIRELAKGGMSRRERVQGKALQGALALVEAEMGRRVGLIIAGVNKMADDMAKNATNVDLIMRTLDWDQASEQGQKAMQGLADANVASLTKQADMLKDAQAKALRVGDKTTAKEIGDQLKTVQGAAAEAAVQSIEAARAAVVAGAQKITDDTNKLVTQRATNLNRSQRMGGVDAMSGEGQRQTAAMLTANQGSLQGAAAGLQGQLAKLSKMPGRGGAAAKAVQEQLDAINDQIAETVVQIAEATRAAIVADAQKIADDANTQVQRAQAAFDQSLRRNGIDAASSAGQKALAEFLAGQNKVLQDSASALTGKLADLQRVGGSAADIKTITDAIQGINDQITENVLAMADAARQAVLQASQEAVDAAGHGQAMADIGSQQLELTQKLAGTYDTQQAAQDRANYTNANTIPALQAQLAALQAQQTAIQQQTPNDLASLRQVQEAIGQKQIDIMSAQLDAQQEVASNTADMLKKFGGATTFEFGGQQYTDFADIGAGL